MSESQPQPANQHISTDLTVGSIPRQLVAFAVPMLAGSLLQTGYSLINAFWVGKFLGPSALATVTVSLPVVFVLISLAAGLTLATNVLIAQYAGARDWKGIKRTVQTSIVFINGLSLLLLALGLLFARWLLVIVQTPPEIIDMATSYLRIFLWTLPFFFAIFLIGSMLRGIGDSRTPVYFQAVSVVINAVLDPLLMFGWLGFPKLGLNGTAWATIISQIIAVIALLIYVDRRRPLVAPEWHRLCIDGETTRRLVMIGFPSALQQSMVSTSMVFITRYVSAFGTTADAAFGAALRIDQVSFLPALTIGLAVSTLTGQNIGAGRLERVRETLWWGMLLSGVICGIITIAVIATPATFLRAFISDPQVITIGAGYLRIVGFTYVLYAVMFASNGVINGAGHTLTTTVVTLLALLGIRVPLAYYLSHALESVTGVWIAMTISVAVGMLLSLAVFFTGRWKRPVVRRGM
ncbi:MAG TPA: MATE family efflux transporter [Armatimonadota bacterium]